MWFTKPKGTSVALIDIGATSVGAALVRIEEGKEPMLCYTLRLPVEQGAGSDVDALSSAALRTLETIAERLTREGAPAMRAVVGEGSVDEVVVSFASPWQEAEIATKVHEVPLPFTFTRSFAVGMLGPNEEDSERLQTRTVIATLLNGYLTREPYNKETSRAEMVVLTSTLLRSILDSVIRTLKRAFHTRDIGSGAFVEKVYRALQSLYPHERDFLAIVATHKTVEILSVKRGYLTDVCMMRGDNSTNCLKEKLGELAIRHALPRTVFLITDEAETKLLKTALGDSSISSLWLSDAPLSVIALTPGSLSSSVKTKGAATGDTRLGLLALSIPGER